MLNRMFKNKITTAVFFILIATVITASTALVGRLGDKYRCSFGDYLEQNRDARGIPFIVVQRSVQNTSCSPVYMDETPLPNLGGHTIDTTNIFLNIIFWYLVLIGLRQFFRAVESSKTLKN